MWITVNWKILKEMGIPDHLTCLLRNLYAGQEATVRTGHGTDWFQIGKGIALSQIGKGTVLFHLSRNQDFKKYQPLMYYQMGSI